MSVALPYIKADFKLSAIESGMVISAFFAAYSIAQIPGGLLVDYLGVRRVATVALVWWSLFTAITGAAGSFVLMLVARFFFGLGEGVYPTCAFKVMAVWFPKHSRGTANAIMLSASRLGQAIAPLFVVWIMATMGGWRHVFYILFIPGLIAAALFWFFVPNTPAEGRGVPPAELEELTEDEGGVKGGGADKAVSLWAALKDTALLRYVLIYFLFDFAYWGFLTWFPTYLVEERGFSMIQMGIAASLPFFAGTVGCLLGGWASDRLFGENRRVPVIVLPVVSAVVLYLTYISSSLVMIIIAQSVLNFALNMFSSSFWALPLSSIPKEKMGISSGIINTGGQVAGALAPLAVGILITLGKGSYALSFGVLIASLVLTGLVALNLPRSQARPENATHA